jgi:DNA-binding transcriptional ArsR family regulator
MATELLARVRADIDARLAELRPAIAEYERLLGAAGTLDTGKAPGNAPSTGAVRSPTRRRVPGGRVQQAIVAALEHGSHTVSELVLVTAMSGPEIRESLRRLQRAGTITRARRDGRAAYALSKSSASG